MQNLLLHVLYSFVHIVDPIALSHCGNMYYYGALNAFPWKTDDFFLQINPLSFSESLHHTQILYEAVWKNYCFVVEYFVASV